MKILKFILLGLILLSPQADADELIVYSARKEHLIKPLLMPTQ